MARLIDEIRAGKKLTHPGSWCLPISSEDWDTYRRTTMSWFKEHEPIPVLVIPNVAEYLYNHYPQEQIIKFPRIAPPYKVFWTEFEMNARLRKSVPMLAENVDRVGVLAATLLAPCGDNRWTVGFTHFVECQGTLYGPVGRFHINIDDQGNHCEFSDSTGKRCGVGTDRPISLSAKEAQEEQFTLVLPTILAMCFLNCRNVTTIENSIPQPLAKKYHARTGIWPTRYRTLVIEPMKEVLRREGQIAEVGLERALHICRGHFATYPEDGPGLFGKGIHGQVWIPQHLRGKRKPDQSETPPREIKFKLGEE